MATLQHALRWVPRCLLIRAARPLCRAAITVNTLQNKELHNKTQTWIIVIISWGRSAGRCRAGAEEAGAETQPPPSPATIIIIKIITVIIQIITCRWRRPSAELLHSPGKLHWMFSHFSDRKIRKIWEINENYQMNVFTWWYKNLYQVSYDSI